jgi:hypothetical protein
MESFLEVSNLLEITCLKCWNLTKLLPVDAKNLGIGQVFCGA